MKKKQSTTTSPSIYVSDDFCIQCGKPARVFLYAYENPDPDGGDILCPCPECFPDQLEALTRKYRQIIHQRKVERLLGESQLSPRFQVKTFENYDVSGTPQKEAIFYECKSFAEDFPVCQTWGTWFTFMGPCGTGKGHLSAAIIKAVIQLHGATALFVKLHDLVREIKQSWGQDSEKTEDEILKVVRGVDLLVLDDIGMQFETKTERLILYSVLDYRYEYLKPTILTTNLNLLQLEKVIGERIVDRLHEGGNRILVFDWESYRRKSLQESKPGKSKKLKLVQSEG